MLGWYQDTERNLTYIAMEYYPNGNLRDWLRDSAPQGELWARNVIKQVLNVLVELALAGLAHRNIKPAVCLPTSLLPPSALILTTVEYPHRLRPPNPD